MMKETLLMKYQPKNILVTGGAGFIGSNFIYHMLETDSQINIVNLDLLTYAGSLDNVKTFVEDKRYAFIQADICDANLIEQLFRTYSIDTVVHFAAESHVDRSIASPEIFVKTNVLGTFTLLEAAKVYWLQEKNKPSEQCRFYHISTDEVYGMLKSDDSPFVETNPYAPNSPYSASKAGSDHLVRAYFHTYGLPAIISNCSNNYGPYQHTEKFIPTVIRQCLNNQTIPIYGDGSNIRDWLYVEDHCRAITILMQKGRLGETYNIGGCNEQSNLVVAKLICQIMDNICPKEMKHETLISFVTDRPGHDWRYAVDIGKIYDEFDWQPEVDFMTGLQQTVKWYLEKKMGNLK